jgi:LL-diaminopimelate aminotransferase
MTTSVSLPAPAARLTSLPIYVFAWLEELRRAATARGADVIDLGIGNPDRPTPAGIVAAMTEAWRDPATHGYPPFRGDPVFLASAAAWMQRRFGVALDPASELLALSGAKEGIAQLSMAFADPDALALVPDIYYPVHGRATLMAGGRVHFLPLRAESGFLPDVAAIPADVAAEAKVLFLNYPHNPTGAVATLAFFEAAVAFCRAHGIVLVSDLAYCAITFDGFVAPSVLEVPGARDLAIEFHSCSKSFNMAGSRIGFAAGNAELISALYAVRSNMGYGTPVPVQRAAAYAFDHAESLTRDVAETYRERRDAVVAGFGALGWPTTSAPASMFVWLPVPAGFTSEGWTQHLLDRADVLVTPGHAFGPGGEGWFRVSLVHPVARLQQAFARLAQADIRFTH